MGVKGGEREKRKKLLGETHKRSKLFMLIGVVLSVMFGLNGQFGSTVEPLLTHTPPLRIWAMDIRGYGV